MANLSQNDRNIIAKHPLDTSFDHLREPFRETEQNYKPNSLSFNGVTNNPDYKPQKAISKLLFILMGHKVAYNLRSIIRNSNITIKLLKLFGLIQSGYYNYEHYCALLRLVIKQAFDIDIWNAVFDFITTVFKTTPFISIPPFFDGTFVMILFSSQ